MANIVEKCIPEVLPEICFFLLSRSLGQFLLACVASVSVQVRSSRFISRAVETESPLSRYFFAPKPNGNACYAE